MPATEQPSAKNAPAANKTRPRQKRKIQDGFVEAIASQLIRSAVALTASRKLCLRRL